ncbi:MAG: FAD-dependent oxidoreductase [Synechococcales cyanobacterium T60_A2020_003]|nr:FAD-dependent oxidoreductase [Synechococcales cyanobacterium T60_A2020_003]
MTKIVVVGSGVVGAAIAYELSQCPDVDLVLLDKQSPAQAATGAALGVLMGIISQKTKGRAWRLRHTSIQRFHTLIPELETLTGEPLPVNTDGIVMLLPPDTDLAKWDALIDLRKQQGWSLERWSMSEVQERCPALNPEGAIAAIYSPQDRQINPSAFTQALIAGAVHHGAKTQFGVEVIRFETRGTETVIWVRSPDGAEEAIATDLVIIAAGLGSTPLTERLHTPVDVRPVLGQAMRVRLPEPLSPNAFHPVMTAHDIHVVPLGGTEYWVGATVEFPLESGEVIQEVERLEEVWQGAIALCPALVNAEIVQTWSGLRPRPFNRSAPIIEAIPGQESIVLATGHYRNGVLLAPATALMVKEMVQDRG